MCSEEITAEVEALEAIYCGPNEFEIHQKKTGWYYTVVWCHV